MFPLAVMHTHPISINFEKVEKGEGGGGSSKYGYACYACIYQPPNYFQGTTSYKVTTKLGDLTINWGNWLKKVSFLRSSSDLLDSNAKVIEGLCCPH